MRSSDTCEGAFIKLRDISLVFEYMNRDDILAAFTATASRFSSYLCVFDPLISLIGRIEDSSNERWLIYYSQQFNIAHANLHPPGGQQSWGGAFNIWLPALHATHQTLRRMIALLALPTNSKS